MSGGILMLLCGIPSIGLAQDLPLFIQELISEHEEAMPQLNPTPVTGSPENIRQVRPPTLEIWQTEYDGETVFFLPTLPQLCCDTFSRLYDADGTLICYPDGGITGKGDGRCPDFIGGRGRGVLVYRGPQSEEP
jgi:hypothetical protein